MLEHIFFHSMLGGLIFEPVVSARNVRHEPPPPPYRKASAFGVVPDFIAGVGVLYVKRKNLRYGPFLAYDRDGRLVSTVYKIPLRDFDGHVVFPDLPAPGGRVTHVSFCLHEAHPGAEERHYHIILWHVSKVHEKRVES